MKKILLMMSISVLVFSLFACEKKEEQTVSKSPMPKGPIIDTLASAPGHGTTVQKTDFQVVVPPEVKEQWAQVIIIVDDKKENKKQEYTLNIGDELKIPDSRLTVKIGPFLPNFKMSGTVITSSSNDPINPSLGIQVSEDGKRIFPASGKWGWLYSKFPTIHSFQHERYGLMFKEGVKK